MRRPRFRLKDSSGAAAVEFALILPPLMLLIAGAIELGWTLHCASSVRWSLETSARKLMLDPSETADTLKADMVGLLAGVARADNLTVTIVEDDTNPTSRLLVARSVFRTNLQVPLVDGVPLTFTSQTKVPMP